MDDETIIGRISEVSSSAFKVVLRDFNDDTTPTITVGDQDFLVGQLGSYVLVVQAGNQIVCMVTGMIEQEKAAVVPPAQTGEVLNIPFVVRSITVAPIGHISNFGEFVRGTGASPTTGAVVHVMSSGLITSMFSSYINKNYDVGHLSGQGEQRIYLDPSSLFGRHFSILGQTGSGKSFTVASLIQKVNTKMKNSHVILLDLHGEYSWVNNEVRVTCFEEGSSRHIDARDLEMPYWMMTFAELCDLLIDRSEFSAHNQMAVFRDAVRDLRLEEGERLGLPRVTLDTPIYFDLTRVREIVEAKNGQVPGAKHGTWKNGPLTGVFDNFLLRLGSRLGDVRYDFLLKPKARVNSESLVELLRDFVGLGDPKVSLTILDLSGVPFDVRPTLAAQVGRLLFEFNYWNPQYREFPLLLVCEEAHAYIPRDNDAQFSGARKSMERIAKEGRKYGVGLGVVSQRPHELSETVLSQCGTFLCLRITNPSDQAYIRSLVPEAERDLVDVLSGLGRGEVMAMGEAVPLPTRIQIDLPNPEPNSNDVDFYSKWTDGPADLDVDGIVQNLWRQEKPDS